MKISVVGGINMDMTVTAQRILLRVENLTKEGMFRNVNFSVGAGNMTATVAQQPDKMGETAVNTAIQLINGETVENSIPVEVTLITKDNVE